MSGMGARPNNIFKTQYVQPATGATVTADPNTQVLQIDPATGLLALTINMPANPVEGQDFSLSSSQAITTLGLVGSVVGAVTALLLGGYARYNYCATAAKWFRVG